MDVLQLPCLLSGNGDRSTSEQCHQFIKGRCRIQAKGRIAVAIVIVNRSRLIQRKFNVCIICLDALRRHIRCQFRCGIVNDDAVRADYSALVARLIHRIGIYDIAAVLIQCELAVRCLREASPQQLIIGQHFVICGILYPVCVIIVGLYAGKGVRGMNRHRGGVCPDVKGQLLLRLLPVIQSKGDTVGFSRKAGRCGIHLNRVIQLHCIGYITRCVLLQIVSQLYTVRVTLRVIEDTARIALLLGKADGITHRCYQLDTIRPAVRSQPFYGRSDIHGLILDVEGTPRRIYILADSLNPHSRIVADFYIVLISLDNKVGVQLQVPPIIGSHTCGCKIFRRQGDRFARIILGGLLLEQVSDIAQSVLCHWPFRFGANTFLIIFYRHLTVDHFSNVIRRHGIFVIRPP